MNNMLALTTAAIAGVLLGVLFFGGLWWTVRKGLTSTRPVLWFLASSVLRTGMVLIGFYVASGGHWQRLIACLIGFVIARFAVTRLTQGGVHASNA